MTRVRMAAAVAAVFAGVTLGIAGCHGGGTGESAPQPAGQSQQGAGNDLNDIQSTLDKIDNEMNGDDAP
jgi:hypothetical protein